MINRWKYVLLYRDGVAINEVYIFIQRVAKNIFNAICVIEIAFFCVHQCDTVHDKAFLMEKNVQLIGRTVEIHLHCNYANEAIADPWNRHNYFICIRKKKLKNKYFLFRRHCPDGEIFNPMKQICYKIYNNRPKPPPCNLYNWIFILLKQEQVLFNWWNYYCKTEATVYWI